MLGITLSFSQSHSTSLVFSFLTTLLYGWLSFILEKKGGENLCLNGRQALVIDLSIPRQRGSEVLRGDKGQGVRSQVSKEWGLLRLR